MEIDKKARYPPTFVMPRRLDCHEEAGTPCQGESGLEMPPYSKEDDTCGSYQPPEVENVRNKHTTLHNAFPIDFCRSLRLRDELTKGEIVWQPSAEW